MAFPSGIRASPAGEPAIPLAGGAPPAGEVPIARRDGAAPSRYVTPVEPLPEGEFEKKADVALRALEAQLAELDGVEVELSMGVLSIELEDGAKYVVNSHRAARQIWMAAERSAWHFDWIEGGWRAAKDGSELGAALSGVLGRKLGRAVSVRV